MKKNLVVGVLGNQGSGKSHTWDTLFGRKVKTGKKMRFLDLTDTQRVKVFLVYGSCEERGGMDVGEIIGKLAPRIVLISMQPVPEVRRTIQYFRQRDYFLYMHWLNPGYGDLRATTDTPGLLPLICGESGEGGLVLVRNGKIDATPRVLEMRKYILEWASSRSLLEARPVLLT